MQKIGPTLQRTGLTLPKKVATAQRTWIDMRANVEQARTAFTGALSTFLSTNGLQTLAKATGTDDYQEIMRGLMDSLGVTITRLAVAESGSTKLSELHSNRIVTSEATIHQVPNPEGTSTHFLIQSKIRASFITPEPYCFLLMEGSDPNRVIDTLRIFFEQGLLAAMANWRQRANP
jgi:hypothetical protein